MSDVLLTRMQGHLGKHMPHFVKSTVSHVPGNRGNLTGGPIKGGGSHGSRFKKQTVFCLSSPILHFSSFHSCLLLCGASLHFFPLSPPQSYLSDFGAGSQPPYYLNSFFWLSVYLPSPRRGNSCFTLTLYWVALHPDPVPGPQGSFVSQNWSCIVWRLISNVPHQGNFPYS